MNLLEIFSRLHYRKKLGWVETTAAFTGKSEQAVMRSRLENVPADFLEYEIRYYADGDVQYGWYCFYPLPDPAPEELAGTKVKIRYLKRRPFRFEILPEEITWGNK